MCNATAKSHRLREVQADFFFSTPVFSSSPSISDVDTSPGPRRFLFILLEPHDVTSNRILRQLNPTTSSSTSNGRRKHNSFSRRNWKSPNRQHACRLYFEMKAAWWAFSRCTVRETEGGNFFASWQLMGFVSAGMKHQKPGRVSAVGEWEMLKPDVEALNVAIRQVAAFFPRLHHDWFSTTKRLLPHSDSSILPSRRSTVTTLTPDTNIHIRRQCTQCTHPTINTAKPNNTA